MRRTHPFTWLLLGVLAIGLPACRHLGSTRGGASPTPIFSPAPNNSPAPPAEGPLPPPPLAGFSKPKAAQTDVKTSVAGTEPRRGWWSRLWPGGPSEKSSGLTEMSPVSAETEVELNDAELLLPEVPMESTRVELPQWQQLSATEVVEQPVPPPQDAEDFFPMDNLAAPQEKGISSQPEVVVEIDISSFLAELDFNDIESAFPVAPPIVTGPVAHRPNVSVQSAWQPVGGPDAYPKQGVDHGIRIEPGPIGAPLPMETGRPKLLPWRASPVWAGQNPGWDGREIR